MHPAIADKLDEIIRLCREHGVARLEVFGSAARGHDFDPATSDADFLVEFADWTRKRWLGDYFELQASLSKLLGRPVDLVQRKAIDNRVASLLIDRDREVVYAR